MASSISNGLVFTIAMVVPTTLLYLAFSNQNSQIFNKQILPSCLYSKEKRKERKKKRVKFAQNVMVKEEKDNTMKMKEKQNKVLSRSKCKNGSMENSGMRENRVVLYKGMLRDRGQRMACCH
ncbi:hypothetical protein Lal_00023572 [Lupinus albus]|uniref:Uncharacterized protein n=1 Tax=Lupinus albus TaxID=3870 RepID=A0A6A4R7Q4_LUPAL|nr:hypothetical protein Lalb_Chr01g0012401 [Lupinus albus]KAF1898570.1 hypothetical protein Lal_00023572 [Lupinus albus]